MKLRVIVLVERLVLLAGFLAIVVSVGAVDWRLGLFVAGAGLIVSTSPWKDLR